MFTATKALVEKYARTFAAHHVRLREAEELIRKPNAEKALQLKAKYRDAAIVRAMLDEVIDMMKESAKKRGTPQRFRHLSNLSISETQFGL